MQTQNDSLDGLTDYEWSVTYLSKAAARLSELGPSRFVVGSSSASIPQLRQKVSANASLMISEART